MKIKATATLFDGSKISGFLTTENPSSSYNQPIFVDDSGKVYDWFTIKEINTSANLGFKKSDKKANASRENGKKGGRPTTSCK